MCGGTGSILGAALGYALAPVTGGASLALATAAGAAAGDALIDKPQAQMKQAQEQQATAANQAVEAAQKQADEATKANQEIVAKIADQQKATSAQMNQPDFAARLYKTKQQQGGPGSSASTMLTGPQGVDVGSLNLGKNSLLGS